MRNWLLTMVGLPIFLINAIGQQPLQKSSLITFICPPCGNPCDTMHFDVPGICTICGMQLYAAYKGYENKEGNTNTQVQKNVAILVWPGVQIIDFTGPYEVFGQAGMNVYTVGEQQSQIETNMHLKIVPDYSFANAPQPDILVIPGGSADYAKKSILQWIKKTDSLAEHTMSVCTGAFYLASAGLLNNKTATTYYTSITALQKMVPTATLLDTIRFADNGHIITSAGLSSGIDAALHVVSLYLGTAVTKRLANTLEYNWNVEAQYVRGKQADKYLLGFLDVFTPFDHEITTYKGNENTWQLGLTLNTKLPYKELVSLLHYQLENAEKWNRKDARTWQFNAGNAAWLSVLDVSNVAKDTFKVLLTLNRQ